MSGGEPFFYHRLDNGLRVVVEPMGHTKSAAVGFLIRAGSRDEQPSLAGASHFIEHMSFKGTAKRSGRQINVDFDRMGAYYNAYTAKDRTFYFSWGRQGDMADQIELLADMMQSTFPAEEFETEKNVILEEIAMAHDRLEDHLYDLVHEKLWPSHPLSWPVLGRRETIEPMTREHLIDHWRQRYAPGNMVLLVAGNVNRDEVVAAAQRYCGPWRDAGEPPARRPPPAPKEGTAVQQIERFAQQGVAALFAAPSAVHPQQEVARAVASILGGHNSRFYWRIVQEGIAPRASAWWLDYQDCGVMALFGLCPPSKAEALTEAMQHEAALIEAEGVSEAEVQRVKNRRRTSLAAEAESPHYRLSQMAEDIDYRGQARTVEQRLAAVDAVTVEGIGEYLRGWPITRRGYFVSVGPRDWPAIQAVS